MSTTMKQFDEIIEDTLEGSRERFIQQPIRDLLNIFWHWITSAQIDGLFS